LKVTLGAAPAPSAVIDAITRSAPGLGPS
jgi:hypothetical protein